MLLFKIQILRKLVYKILFSIFLFNSILYANNDLLESQPEIIFETDRLLDSQENLEIQVDFNKAVLHLKKGEYEEAIKLFEKTSSFIEIPSLLNIGIAYYKLENIELSKEYLSKIYEKKSNLVNQTFSFISACYYLYEITKDDKYIVDLVTIFQNSNKLSDHKQVITDIKDSILKELANRYLIVKDYKNALGALNAMSYSLDLKKAMIYIKLNQYIKAAAILKKLKEIEKDPQTFDKILWISTFVDLKLNKFEDVKLTLDLINSRKSKFKVNTELPLQIFFNKELYSTKEYFESVLKFDETRKLDFIYYFAPFVFSDSQEIIYDSVKGFIYSQQSNVTNLEDMVEYNSKFLKIVKEDPILRVNELNELIKKAENNRAYMFYNLALSYAQINDIYNASKYFERAYKLNPGNKLYSVMYLITASKTSLGIDDKQKEYLDTNIRNSGGLYSYFAKEIYKLFVNTQYISNEPSYEYENTMFYKAIDFLKTMDANKSLYNHKLLDEYERDPLIYLIKLIQRKPQENDFTYYSRIQDNIPLIYNNNFLQGALIIPKYYIDILKALGIFSRADFYIEGNKSPTYILTTVMRNLYLNKEEDAIQSLNYLRDNYKYDNRFTMYLTVAAYLEARRYEDASIQISLIKAFYKDTDTDFLTAIQLIQNLNINSAKQFLNIKYQNPLIDFQMIGFDEYLQSL
ncbi:tetratricopeptide repeat protein [Arcobacter lacus]|nr:hypothetical protein [Arcobacter lacus]